MNDQTIVHWDFFRLFMCMPCVHAKVNAPKSNPKCKSFSIKEIVITPVRRSRFGPPGRNLCMDVSQNSIQGEDVRSGLYGSSLAETLLSAGAKKHGYIDHGSYCGFWRLNPGEHFCDGAIRVGKLIFAMLEIRVDCSIKFRPTQEQLVSSFVVYKRTWVSDGPHKHKLYDDVIRAKHGLPDPGPLNMFMLR